MPTQPHLRKLYLRCFFGAGLRFSIEPFDLYLFVAVEFIGSMMIFSEIDLIGLKDL
jgi:hypothetical protein